MEEMFFRNARFNPSMAVPINVTVTMPITMPSVVSTERILFARMALQEMSRPSRSSVTKFMAKSRTKTSNIQRSTTNAETRRHSNQEAWRFAVECWWLNVSQLRLHASILARGFFITCDQAVADADDAARLAGHVFFVGHDDDGVAARGKLLEQRHDVRAGFGIQIAG